MARVKSEKKITVEGEEYCLKCTFDVIAEIEDYLDKSILEIAAYLSGGKVKVRELAFILRQTLMAGGHEVSEKDTMDLIESMGYNILLDTVSFAIEYAFPPEESGGKKPRKAKA